MIVNFSNIVFDSYGKLECPTLFLKTLAGQSIQPIVNYYNLRADFKYNDVSTITFDITDRFSHDGEMKNNPAYEEICGLRIVEMEPFGQFILMQPEISDDGIRKVKSCTAYSLEYELNFKTMPPLSESEGGYQFYNTANDQSSLMHIVLSKLPNWTIGYVSPSVCTRVRNFSTSSENIYSFLMNTVQESYNCLFIFDIKERKINVYDASDDARIENIPIYISKENLINEITLSEITEDIVTCLSVYGADNISIDSVNPLGTEKLYNIDYFIENGDVPSPIAKKWNQWKSDVDIYQKLFAGVYSQLYSNLVVYNSQKIKLDELKNELDTQNTLLSSYKADTDLNSDHSQAIKECENKIASINADISEQATIVENANAEIEKSKSMMSDITSLCKIENYFLDYEYKILVQFFKEGSIQDSTFVSTNVATTPDSCISVVPDDDFKVYITEGNLYKAEEYVWLTEDEKASASFDSETIEFIDSIESEVRTYLNKNFYTIDIGNIVISNRFANDQNNDKAFHLSGTVINSTVSYDNTVLPSGRYDGVVTFTIVDVVYNGEKYGTATFTAIGEISSFSHSNREENNKDAMSFSINSGILTLTCKSTIYQKQETIQQLYDYGKACINKLAFPSYEFSINSSNFIFSEQFAAFKNQVELGKSINVEFNEDLFRRPILIGVELNYEDLTDFNLTFSNKFRSNSAEFLLSDVIGKSSTAMSNLDASKFSYAAFSNSSLENDVTTLMNEAFDVSKRQIVNANNQSLLIDDAGIHLRKMANKLTEEFNPNQIRMINNKIAFTTDNWENVSLAIGEMNIGDSTFMGVVADSLIGKALIGNQLTIEANKINNDGSNGIMTFRVDGQGAYLGNGAIYMEDESSKNKVAFDPKYGLIAGDRDLFEIGSTGAVMKAINPDGSFEHDGKFEVLPKGASFWLDMKNNNAYFRGDIYANNGYFAGELSVGAYITQNGSPYTMDELATNASDAFISASKASQDAEEARNSVSGVIGDVQDAKDYAALALESAQDAKDNALSALKDAEDAKTAAESVLNDVEEAKKSANEAKDAANVATENANAATITAAQANEKSNAAQESVQIIQNDLEIANTEIENLADNLDTMSHTMETDYARKTDLSSTETNLQTQISQNAAQIESTAKQVTEIDAAFSEAAADAVAQAQAAQQLANAAKQQAEAAEENVEVAQKAAEDAAQAATDAQTLAYTAKTAAQSAQDKADRAAEDLAVAEENLIKVTSRVDATDAEIEAAKGAVEAAQNAVKEANDLAANANTLAAQAQKDADDAKGVADAAQAAAVQAREDAKDAKDAADKAQQDVNALGKRVKAAETAITQNAQAIELSATKEEIKTTIKEVHRYYIRSADGIPEKPTTFPPTNTFTWDGNIDGLYNELNLAYLVSDLMPTYDELIKGGVATDNAGNVFPFISDSILDAEVWGIGNDCVLVVSSNGGFLFGVAYEAGASISDLPYGDTTLSMTFEEPGLYIGRESDSAYIKTITINEYDGFDGWTEIEPNYSDTESLYTTICAVHLDNTFNYSDVSLSSSDSAVSDIKNVLENNYYSKEETDSELKVLADGISANTQKITTEVKRIDGDIYSVNEWIEDAKFVVEPGGITSVVRASEAYINDLGEKVSTNEIISCINQSPESITISASKVNLEAAVTIKSLDSSLSKTINDSKSMVTTASETLAAWCHNNDLTYIDGGKIYTGSITADKIAVNSLEAICAKIGGFNIDSASLYNGINSLSSTGTGVYLGTDGIRCGSNFIVRDNGGMSAISANLQELSVFNKMDFYQALGYISGSGNVASALIGDISIANMEAYTWNDGLKISGDGCLEHNVPTRFNHVVSMMGAYFDNTITTGGDAKIGGIVTANGFNGNATSASQLGTATLGDATQPIYLNNGQPVECSNYAGGTSVILNGTSKASTFASIYAPTTSGSKGNILMSNGSGEPSWMSTGNHSESRTGVIYVGNVAIAFGVVSITTGSSTTDNLYLGSTTISFGVTYTNAPAVLTSWSGSYANMHSTGSYSLSTTGAKIWGRTTTGSSERTIQWVSIGLIG